MTNKTILKLSLTVFSLMVPAGANAEKFALSCSYEGRLDGDWDKGSKKFLIDTDQRIYVEYIYGRSRKGNLHSVSSGTITIKSGTKRIMRDVRPQEWAEKIDRFSGRYTNINVAYNSRGGRKVFEDHKGNCSKIDISELPDKGQASEKKF